VEAREEERAAWREKRLEQEREEMLVRREAAMTIKAHILKSIGFRGSFI
jgi:hypothetical protein